MPRLVLVLFATILLSCFAAAQEGPVTGTELPDTARFQIVQPSFDRVTFRLDRYTGQIHRLSTCPKDDSIGSNLCWKEMTVVNPMKGDLANRPRFQILMLNAQKMILLQNVETGNSWQYGIDPQTDRWFPFLECNDRTSSACYWKP
jgi:hypothetical protein